MKVISRSGCTASCSLKLGSTQAGGHLHTLATLSFGKEPRVSPGQAPELVWKLKKIYISFTAAGK
jgi:hypothetical protein